MAKNIIQFQKGLSLPKFLEKYGTEEQWLFDVSYGFQYGTRRAGNHVDHS